MVLLKLYWSFLLIGFSSFGGLSMIPQISTEMTKNGWMTAGQVTDIVAIAEMTPGPMGLNCATFAGMQAAGVPGAIAANLGALTPSITLCALAAAFFFRFRESRLMNKVLMGVRPACLGMLLGLLCSLLVSNYFPEGKANLPAMFISGVDLLLLLKWKMGIPKIILISAAMGLVMFGLL